jgi:methionyl-tRNA formyltransferase
MLSINKIPRIVFLGTPDFAVASLSALIEAGFPIAAVVTAPDKPAGRGMLLTESPVKKFALSHQIPVLQPTNLKSPAFIEELKSFRPDLQIVVAFRMLPEVVWNLPPMGTINLHGSLLPDYRGAAPINWAIINGEKETGVSTFKLQHAIDTGNILMQKKISIQADTTAGELHDIMKEIGANLIVKTVQGLIAGTITEKPQENGSTSLKQAPKIHTDHCNIDFNQPVYIVHNLIRGLSPFPGAFTQLNGKIFKIFSTSVELCQPEQMPGTCLSDGKSYLKFACKDGYISCREVQLEGKKRLDIGTFLRGYRIS